MKVLFLDFDGVLNSWENQNIRNALSQIDNSTQSKDVYGYYFDEKCVRYLQYILAKTNAKIVVTSFWRWRGKDTIQLMWKERNLPGEIYDTVRFDKSSKKGDCIKDWLNNNEIDSFCIVDDMDLFLDEQKQNLILVNGYFGLNWLKSNEIIELLNE